MLRVWTTDKSHVVYDRIVMIRRASMSCLFLLVTLTACSTSGGSADTAEPASTRATVGSIDTADKFASPIPTVPDDQRADLVAELDAIAPGLATEPEDTIDNARNTCDSIRNGSQKLIEATKLRFIGDGVDEMSDDQAQQIVDLIAESSWCR